MIHTDLLIIRPYWNHGNSIFLPAAGWREVTSLYKKGEICDYWSSSVNESSPSSVWEE